MSSINQNDNNDEDNFPIRQVPYDNHTNNNQVAQAPQINRESVPAQPPPTYRTATTTPNVGFGGLGGFGRPATTTASVSTGGLFGAAPGAPPGVHATGMGMAFGCFQPANNPAATGLFGGPPVSRPVERHPETGQPINRGACGGIQTPGIPFGVRPNDDKKKNLDNVYAKLAQARAKIAELNKFLDEIYEILPKIN